MNYAMLLVFRGVAFQIAKQLSSGTYDWTCATNIPCGNHECVQFLFPFLFLQYNEFSDTESFGPN